MIHTYDDSNYSTYQKNKFNDKMKIRSHLVTERFLLIVVKVLASDTFIQRRSLNNINKFISSIDRKFYSNDTNIMGIIMTIEVLLASRLKTNTYDDIRTIITKVDTTLIDGYEDVKNNLIIPTCQISKTESNESELEYINETLEQNLKYNKILSKKDDLSTIAEELSSSSYTDTPGIMKRFRDVVTNIYEFFKDTDNEADISSITHTSDPTFLDYIRETFKVLKNPKTVLKTGIKALNDMLGLRGGFQNGRYYIFYANTNTFKSALLLHISKWIRRYNGNTFQEMINATGKTPTVLHVSLENSKDEDIERLYKTELHADLGICDTEANAVNSWVQSYADANSPIDIAFKHGDSNTYRVSDINKMCDVLDEQGFTVICVVIDYIELIKPEDEDMRYETRLQLAKISERLLNLAKSRNIPVITAHQLNRAGGANLKAVKESGQQNAVLALDNSFIGESYGIQKPVDFSAFIDIEHGIHDKDKKYLCVSRGKFRGKAFGTGYFVHEIYDGIILKDDYLLDKSLSMESVPNANGEIVSANIVNKANTTGKRGAFDVREKKEDNSTTPLNNTIVIGNNDSKNDTKYLMYDNIINVSNWYTFMNDSEMIDRYCESEEFDITDENIQVREINGIEYIFND